MYPLGSQIYDNCYNSDPTMTSSSSTIAYTATQFTVESTDPFANHDEAHKFCFLEDPDKDDNGNDMVFWGHNRLKSFTSWCSFISINSYSL
mmetsp:Transcript_20646/g.31491  ORF Transcript_20646/g.31491 Transcript_20646/m.31491 type:complete len:91 (+) Transcript_20646:1379-1651(+)